MKRLIKKNLRAISNALVAFSFLLVAVAFNTSPAQAFAGTLENGNMAYAQSAFATGEACIYLPGFTTGYDAWHFVLTSRGATFQQSATNPAVAINLNMVFMRPDGSIFVIKSGAWVQTGKGAYVYTLVSERDRMVQAGTVASINGLDSGMRLSHTCPGSGAAPATSPSPTASATPTASASPSPTATRSSSPSPTTSASPTPTATRSATPTPTPTASASASPTPSPSSSTSSSPTPSATPSSSPSPTPTSTVIPTLAPQPNPTASAIQIHRSRSPSPRNPLPTPSASPQGLTSPSPTPTPSRTPSSSPTPTPSVTPTPSASPSTSSSPTPSNPPVVLPTPPANLDPQNLIFVDPKTPTELPPSELPKAPNTPVDVVTPPKYGEVTITPAGVVTYTSNLTNLKSTVVDEVTFKYTNLSGQTVVVRKQFILNQKGDVPKIIQTGYGSSGSRSSFALIALALISAVAAFALRGSRKNG